MATDEELADQVRDLYVDDMIGLVLAPTDRYHDTAFDIMEALAGDGTTHGLYIAVNQPYSSLLDRLDSHEIPTDAVYFIDVATKQAGAGAVPEDDRVTFLDSPGDLTELSLTISRAAEAMPAGQKFVLIDSLSALAAYNSADTVVRFAHQVISGLKQQGFSGALLSLADEDDAVTPKIGQFCDRVIRVD